MTKEEYIEFSECRQASFTYKKSKKFREWLGPFSGAPISSSSGNGSGAISTGASTGGTSKPSDDVLEILGFLLWEGLRRLTMTALRVQTLQASSSSATAAECSEKESHCIFSSALKLNNNIFSRPSQRKPLLPKHIYESYSQLQEAQPKSILRRFSSPSAKRPIILI